MISPHKGLNYVMTDFKTFFIDVGLDAFDHIEEYIKHRYTYYLIAFESQPRDHYHVLLETDTKGRTSALNYFVRKYDLKKTDGKHGGKVKYGAVSKSLETIEKYKRYLCKQGNVRSSEDVQVIEQYIKEGELRYDKNEGLFQKVLKYLNENIKGCPEYDDIRYMIIQQIFNNTDKDYNPSRQFVEKILQVWVRNNRTVKDYMNLIYRN